MTQETKQVLLRVPVNQFKELEKIAERKKLKNVQALIYRILEKEIEIDDT